VLSIPNFSSDGKTLDKAWAEIVSKATIGLLDSYGLLKLPQSAPNPTTPPAA
jgi:hypothetical protein